MDKATTTSSRERVPPGRDNPAVRLLKNRGMEEKESLYARVARTLSSRIASGKYPVGSLLPTEIALAAELGVGRQTVRAAMKDLLELGLVSRRRHVGTRVEAATPSGGFGLSQSHANLGDLELLARSHVRKVRSTGDTVADRALAKELGCGPGTRWARISSVRMDAKKDGEPICWTDVYIDPEYGDVRKTVRRSPETLVSSLIEKRHGRITAEVHQRIEAAHLPEAIAPELDAAPQSPALKIVRRYLDAAGEMFIATVTWHPADRFAYTMVLKRSGARLQAA
jgi:GntR family transcriptional regulator